MWAFELSRSVTNVVTWETFTKTTRCRVFAPLWRNEESDMVNESLLRSYKSSAVRKNGDVVEHAQESQH
jgi:hypothetical protein